MYSYGEMVVPGTTGEDHLIKLCTVRDEQSIFTVIASDGVTHYWDKLPNMTAMEQNAWAATLDLKDAYGQCPLHESAARWLAAEVNGKVYLPLGLTHGISVAIFIFTKLVQTAWR